MESFQGYEPDAPVEHPAFQDGERARGRAVVSRAELLRSRFGVDGSIRTL